MEGISKPNSAEMKEQGFSQLGVTSGSVGKPSFLMSPHTLTHFLWVNIPTWLYREKHLQINLRYDGYF